MNMKLLLWSSLVIGIAVSACQSADCTTLETELSETKASLSQRDSVLAFITSTFIAIDSNASQMRGLEAELVQMLEVPKKAVKAEVMLRVNQIKELSKRNQELMTGLQQNLGADKEYAQVYAGMVNSLRDRMALNQSRLTKLNSDLGALGAEMRNLFAEYIEAEAARWQLEDNMNQMSGSMAEMEAQLQDLRNQMSTCYVLVGTKKELMEAGVVEKAGLLKGGSINENADLSKFQPVDMNALESLPLGAGKFKVLTEHPEESYSITAAGTESTLQIESPKNFWSISRYLVVMSL